MITNGCLADLFMSLLLPLLLGGFGFLAWKLGLIKLAVKMLCKKNGKKNKKRSTEERLSHTKDEHNDEHYHERKRESRIVESARGRKSRLSDVSSETKVAKVVKKYAKPKEVSAAKKKLLGGNQKLDAKKSRAATRASKQLYVDSSDGSQSSRSNSRSVDSLDIYYDARSPRRQEEVSARKMIQREIARELAQDRRYQARKSLAREFVQDRRHEGRKSFDRRQSYDPSYDSPKGYEKRSVPRTYTRDVDRQASEPPRSARFVSAPRRDLSRPARCDPYVRTRVSTIRS